MRYVVIFTLLFFPCILFAQVNQFVFVSDSSVPQGELVQMTIQAQNSTGDAVVVGDTTCVAITSTSGSLFKDESPDTDAESPLVLTMNSNWKNRNFYYKNATAGSYTLSASIAVQPEDVTCTDEEWPVGEWNVEWTAQQTISVGDPGSNEDTQDGEDESEESSEDQSSSEDQKESSSSGGGTGEPSTYIPAALYAVAGDDRKVIVGTEVVFNGDAVNEHGETEDGVVYEWNFGDGTTARGASVVHTYEHTGTYVATLYVDERFMEMQDTDQVIVEVIDADVEITDVDFSGGTVHITNTSEKDVDLSDWGLSIAGSYHSFPDRTYVLAGASVVMNLNGGSLPRGNVALVLPSGQYASAYTPAVVRAQAPSKPIAAVKSVQSVEVEEKDTISSSSAATYAALESVDVSGSEEEDSSILPWIMAVFGLGLVGGVTTIAIRREQETI
ncbi:MAG: PKD domain-containing protein [Candidatus Paceibacterota bacterium]